MYHIFSKKDDSEFDELEIEPPKFLADIFESVAGAIYLDSDCSLSTVWNVYYKYFEPYLGNYAKYVNLFDSISFHFLNLNIKQRHSSIILRNRRLKF